MKKNHLFYNRYELENIPHGKKIYITKDNQKLYYNDGRSKKYIKELSDMPANKIIKVDVISENSENNIKVEINISIDNEKLQSSLNDPNKFIERIKTLNLIRKCYDQYCSIYNNNIIMNILDNAYNGNQNLEISKDIMDQVASCEFRFHKKNLEWMLKREKESENKYYTFDRPLFLFGNYYIDITKGEFIPQYENLNKKEVRFRGGILVNNNDNDWIYDFINLTKFSMDTIMKNKEYYFSTSSTLVICDKALCNQWKEKAHKINKNIKAIMITCQSDHNKIKYDDIKQSHIVIISNEYLISKQYRDVFKNYICKDAKDNINISLSLDSIRKEYYRCKQSVMNYFSPVLSIFYWNRIIIDDNTSKKILDQNTTKEFLNNFEAYYRWIQINKLPYEYSNMMSFIKYLIKNNDINLPLYDDNNDVVYLNNIIRLNDNSTLDDHNKKVLVKENLVKINMTNFEKKVYNFCIENSNDKNNRQFNKILIDCINQFGINLLPIDEIKSIIKNEKLSIELEEGKECQICCDESSEKIITKCSHTLCIKCILNIIRTSNCCPYCRSSMSIENLYRVQTDKLLPSKINGFINIIKLNINNKSIVICKDNKLMLYIDKHIKYKQYEKIKCIGSHGIKMNKIKKFNNIAFGLFIMSFNDIGLLGDMKNVTNIIFYNDPYSDNHINKNKLLNMDIYSDLEKNNIYYLAYKDTIEEKLYRCN